MPTEDHSSLGPVGSRNSQPVHGTFGVPPSETARSGDVKYLQLTEDPLPTWLVIVGDGDGRRLGIMASDDLQIELGLLDQMFRAAPYESLRRVLRTGIDTDSTTDPFFATFELDNALGYADWPKLVLVLDPDALELTFREHPGDPAQREVAIPPGGRKALTALLVVARTGDIDLDAPSPAVVSAR